MILEKLPKKTQANLQAKPVAKAAKAKPLRAEKRRK